ncbi:MAG: thiamine phosphate synthase [Rhodospirillaceae bacterium]|jgi:thiamine-phosphate pyrophosphorylase|nr:thiamine phosphate synthase [Rhodospirillaceae bacterium]
MAVSGKSDCRLYLVTPPAFELDAFALRLAEALDGGDVACVQLRLKDAPDGAVRDAARALIPICHARDVAFIVNDRPDLAAQLDADGVHVGQEDTSYGEARALLGEDRIVGVTCHDSKHLALEAAEAGADYVAFGAFFPTETKEAKSAADPEILRWWSELMTVPCVAIGGITVGNCAPLVQAGADFLAVVSAVWDHPEGPGAAVAAFNDEIAAALAAL